MVINQQKLPEIGKQIISYYKKHDSNVTKDNSNHGN